MANEKPNKIVYGNNTLIDLTSDTVSPATLLQGETAHDSSGTLITGSYAPTLESLTVKSGSVPMIYTPPSGVDGYSQVTVQKMNIDEQEKIVRPSSSMQRITPSSGYDGLSSVAVLGATLQDKTVTPTTYQQTVTKDLSSSYYGLGTVTVEAIPATNITPSNSSPATITSGNLYSAQGNGYAIESYDNVTPSSTPESVSSGDIVKIGGSGVIVDSVPPTPTSITPSNTSSPALVTGEAVSPTRNGYAVQSIETLSPSNSNPVPIEYLYGNIYRGMGNGYAIESYNSITPSNSSPVSLSSGNFYKPSASGYAISSYSSKTPSDTSPASVSSGAIVKASSSGYLVKNTPISIGVPDVISQANISGNSSRTITVTKTPRVVIFLMVRNSDSTGRSYGWCYDVQNSKYEYFNYTADGYGHTEASSALSIITVTSSSVTVTNNTTATCRSHVLIYY